MKIAILDTYYPKFLSTFYEKSDFSALSYQTHLAKLLDEGFGTADFYSFNLAASGVQAIDLVMNDSKLQDKWARENNLIPVHTRGRVQNWKNRLLKRVGRPQATWAHEIVIAQVEKFEPDIVYFQDLSFFPAPIIKRLRKAGRLIVGQIACPLPEPEQLHAYDLILTSFPHYVEKFRKMGIRSEYFKIGFESRLLNRVQIAERDIPLSFVGGLSGHHAQGVKLFENAAKEFPIEVWGYGADQVNPQSPLLRHYHGEAWALKMYGIFARSKMTLNRHIDVAENFANNMRLFEATGMGSLLITDEKSNLADFFEPGKEVVTYKNPADLIEKIRFYSAHETERAAIALAGQKRTLEDHTYANRIKQLIEILRNYV